MKNILICTLAALLCAGCNPRAHDLDPCIRVEPNRGELSALPKAFPPLSPEERGTDWGRELLIGDHFGRGLDLYRAITAYKRAEILIPPEETARAAQIAYNTLFCYFLGNKYEEVIETFETSSLATVSQGFPLFRELLIILYTSYQKTGNGPREKIILQLIEEFDPELAEDLKMGDAILEGDLCLISALSHRASPFIQQRIASYQREALSPKKAQMLNAVLPGAGYWYTGQRSTALTAFILNAAFITATYELFKNHQVAAGVITGSLEFGWYFGGINGAGLSAKNWNDQLYSAYAKDVMLDLRLFPFLQFRRAF